MQQLPETRQNPFSRVGIIGAGAWGTALGAVAASVGRDAILWARESEVVSGINSAHENTRFLPGMRLPANLRATGNLAEAAACDVLLVVVPAQHLAQMLGTLSGFVRPGQMIALCAKGIELGTGRLLSEILSEALPQAEAAMLSGPSFARDVAQGLPTAVVIASRDAHAAQRLQATMGSGSFRPYVSDDVIGVALGGAAKNVYAIACGMVEGAGLGENARAALLARGFAELLRLGGAMGARAETLMGLSGLGDLALTATSMSSRNFSLGAQLGRGERPAEPGPLAEGAATAPALVARGRRHGVELPVAEAVADVLGGKLGVADAAQRLLARPFKAEHGME